MADEQKTLEILLQYGVDQSALQNANTQINTTTSSLANQEQQLRRNRMELRELSQVFTMIGLAGAAIYVPAIAASQEYIKSAGQSEAASKNWLAATDSIKQSTIDIGRVVTEGLLPGYTQVAGLVEKFSEFAKQNPGLINAAVTIGGVLVAIGAGGKIAVDVGRAITDIQLLVNGGMLAAAKIQADAAATMLTAANIQAGVAPEETGGAVAGEGGGIGLMTVLGPIVAAVSGILLGNTVYNAIKQTNAPDAFTTEKQMFTMGIADMVGVISGSIWAIRNHTNVLDEMKAATTRVTIGLGGLLGVVNTPKSTPTGGIGELGGMSQADYNTGLTEFTAHEQTMANIQKTYDDSMTTENTSYYQSIYQADATFEAQQIKEQIAHNQEDEQALQNYQDNVSRETRDFYEQQAQAQQDYEDNVARETRDFNEQQAQALASFQQQQSDAIANFQDSEFQAQQTYQNQMADLEQSHQDKLRDLTQSHDWLGMANENRDYAEQKAKDQRDYDQADAQRREQLAKTLADNQRNYDEQSAQRLASFRQQQADELENYNKSTQRREEAFVQQQADELDNYNKSKQQRDDAFIQQQKDEADQHQTELNTIDQNHRDKIAQLKQNLADQDAVEQAAWLQQYDTLIGVVTTAEAATVALYNAFLQSMGVNTTNAESTSTTHDAGGYFMPGATRNATGKAEWVAAPDTVRYAEQIVGGRLTQQNLIAAMISGRNGGPNSTTYNSPKTFNMSGMTAQDRLLVRGMMEQVVNDKFRAEFGN